MTKKPTNLLQVIGLSDQEALIYTTLLRDDLLNISELSRKTGLHRPALYKLLPSLLSKGLLTETMIGKRKVYKAASPSKLKLLLEDLQSNVEGTIESMQEVYDGAKDKPTISFYRGQEGFITLFDDIATTLDNGDEFYRYSARQVGEPSFRVSKLYEEKRRTKHLERRVITSEAKAKLKERRLDRWIKTIPADFDLFDDNVSQIIYKNKVAFVDHDSHSTFIIESKKIATFQEKLFKLLWKKLDN